MQKIRFRQDILPLKNKLYRLALRITLNPAEAEDVVQEALIKVWNKRSEWSSLQSVEAFCYTVVRNLSIDKSRLGDTQNVELPSNAEAIADKDSPSEKMESSESLKVIHDIINSLPVKQRMVMQLRDIEGKSYKEIADILQLTEEQVKVILYRARQKVKQKYMYIYGYGL